MSTGTLCNCGKCKDREVKGSRTDTERMDWLEGMQGWQGKSSTTWGVAVWLRKGRNYKPTFREKIDAAMDYEEEGDAADG